MKKHVVWLLLGAIVMIIGTTSLLYPPFLVYLGDLLLTVLILGAIRLVLSHLMRRSTVSSFLSGLLQKGGILAILFLLVGAVILTAAGAVGLEQ